MSEGKKSYQKTKTMLSDAGFDLRKYVTECRELQAFFDKIKKSFVLPCSLTASDTKFTESQMKLKNSDCKRVLVIEWDAESDEIVFIVLLNWLSPLKVQKGTF